MPEEISSGEKVPVKDYFQIIEKEFINRPLPEGFENILPRIKEEWNRLAALKIRRGRAKFNETPTEAELASIMKEVPMHYSAELYWREKRQKEEIAAFEDEYRHDPVWEYCHLHNFLSEESIRINSLKDVPGMEVYDCRNYLAEFRCKLSALEEVEKTLLEKFR